MRLLLPKPDGVYMAILLISSAVFIIRGIAERNTLKFYNKDHIVKKLL